MKPTANPEHTLQPRPWQNRPVEGLASLVLGTVLIAVGLALLIERIRANGFFSWWPLILMVVGAAQLAGGPSESDDEGLWLLGIGSWLVMNAVTSAFVHQALSLTVVGAGVATWWQALGRPVLSPALENSHVK